MLRRFLRRRIPTPEQSVLRCSFCNKTQSEVQKLIAGPTVFICDECVQICTDIIREDKESSPTAVGPPAEPHSTYSTQSEPHSTYSTQVVMCTLCRIPLPCEDALVIPERGFLCPGCSGEIEAALARKRENVT